MSSAKKELRQLESLFQALSHQTRREILLVLNFRDGRMTAGEIADRFACRWPTITRHLGVLMKAGLVTVQKEGRTRVYLLQRQDLLHVADKWLDWFREKG